MTVKEKNERREKLSKNAASGIVALIFLILGFQLAVFVMKVVQRPAVVAEQAAEANEEAGGSSGGGAYSGSGAADGAAGGYGGGGAGGSGYSGGGYSRQYPSQHTYKSAQQRNRRTAPQRTRFGGYDAPEPQYKPRPARKVESFPFDPNTVSIEDLVRLGLSERQAETIENYRSKGGRFSSKADFKKMYVVSDSLYERLEPFIDIPKVELNTADSTALVALRGIGPFYARKIIEYRQQLGGYYSPEQLLEVYGMDEERFAPIRERLTTDAALIRPLQLWELPEDSLARHPYLGRSAARSITRYKKVCDTAAWTLAGLAAENILDSLSLAKLRHYVKEQ